jgi:NDP-sugar pyrophosphorylase family protein
MITSAIILAAGRGTRMGELAIETPKPMLRVLGKPLMEYVVDLLSFYGIKEIGVNLFHKGEVIVDHFGDGSKFGVNIQYVQEKELSGTAGGVLQVARCMGLNRPFLVLSSDMLVNFNLRALAESHLASGGIATLSCFHRPKDQLKKSGILAFDPTTRRITDFVERPQDESAIISQWVNSSVYAFSPEILTYLESEFPGGSSIDLPKDIFPKLLAADVPMYAHPFHSDTYYQLGIDSPDRITRAEEEIRSGMYVPVKRT